MPDIRLIATDLDGTLIGRANELPLYKVFRDRMRSLHERNGTVWAACSGRNYASFREFTQPMRHMGVMPDYIVASHAYIYGRKAFGYFPHVLWSLEIWWRQRVGFRRIARAIAEWHRTLRAGSHGVRTVARTRSRLCLWYDSDESATAAADLLARRAEPFGAMLRVVRRGRELEVRLIPFTKGLAVAELTRHLRLRPANVLTVGDGHNDLSMLQPSVAAHTGCPANASPEVKEAVHRHGGHISAENTLAGLMDVLEATLQGRVCSDLPGDWQPAANEQPSGPGRKRSSERHRRSSLWLFAAVTYAVLLVFAHFELIPFAGAIAKPYRMLLGVAEKLLANLMGLMW